MGPGLDGYFSAAFDPTTETLYAVDQLAPAECELRAFRPGAPPATVASLRSSTRVDVGAVARAADGDLWLAGSFDGTLTLQAQQLTAPLGKSGFVARVAPGGQVRWVYPRFVGIQGLVPLADGGALFSGMGLWGGKLPTQNQGPMSVARISATGELRWERTWQGLMTWVSLLALASDGSVLLGGVASENAAIGTTVVDMHHGVAGFVARLSLDGELRQVKTFAGTRVRLQAFAEVGGRWFFGGDLRGAVQLGSERVTSKGPDYDAVVLALDPATLDVRWARTWGASSFDAVNGFAPGRSGGVRALGRYTANEASTATWGGRTTTIPADLADLDPGPGVREAAVGRDGDLFDVELALNGSTTSVTTHLRSSASGIGAVSPSQVVPLGENRLAVVGRASGKAPFLGGKVGPDDHRSFITVVE